MAYSYVTEQLGLSNADDKLYYGFVTRSSRAAFNMVHLKIRNYSVEVCLAFASRELEIGIIVLCTRFCLWKNISFEFSLGLPHESLRPNI